MDTPVDYSAASKKKMADIVRQYLSKGVDGPTAELMARQHVKPSPEAMLKRHKEMM